tara:strand:+ start:5760 stop:6170 length:411 start_codon:yes stop_codon:yes gene_type:complete
MTNERVVNLEPRNRKPTKATDGTGRFSRLPAAAVYDQNLSPQALRVLAALAVHADTQGFCYPSQSTLAKRLGKTRQTIQYHLKLLRDAGYVDIIPNKKSSGAWRHNFYQIHYPSPLEQETRDQMIESHTKNISLSQ